MKRGMPIVKFLGSGDAFAHGGRHQACVLVEGDRGRILLDCGTTTLTAMRKFSIDPDTIDAVVISHYHADHYGGIPFLLLDGHFSRRTRPLMILGPGDVERRLAAAAEVAFPGSSTMRLSFPVTFEELSPGRVVGVIGGSLRVASAAHTPGADAVSVRLTLDGKSIADSGDTEWTDSLAALSAGADLLICEAYTWDKKIPYHMDYRTLSAHRAAITAKRRVLTHFGPDMLAHLSDAVEEAAYDGMRLVV